MAFYFLHNNSSWILKSTIINSPHGFGTRLECKNLTTDNTNSRLPIFGCYSDYTKNIFSLKQVHSNLVWILDDKNGNYHFIHSDTGEKTKNTPQGDALISVAKNCTLVVKTADCFPVILEDNLEKVIAIVHSGWRGTIGMISGKTVESMVKYFNCKRENIRAAIGPGIQSCCYEVSEEIGKRFWFAFSGDVIKKTNNMITPHLDLRECIAKTLIKSGLKNSNIDKCSLCTCCNKKLFYSYRGEKGCDERMYSFCRISPDFL